MATSYQHSPIVQNEPRLSTHSAISRPKSIKPLLGRLEFVLGQLLFVHLGGRVPHLDMVLLEQHNHAGGLRVEGAGGVEHSVVDDFLDAGVRDGGFVAQLVHRAAGLDGVEKGIAVGSHGAGCAGEGAGRGLVDLGGYSGGGEDFARCGGEKASSQRCSHLWEHRELQA